MKIPQEQIDAALKRGVWRNDHGHVHSVLGGIWFGMSHQDCPFCEWSWLTGPYDPNFAANNVRETYDGKWVCITKSEYERLTKTSKKRRK